MDYRTDLGFVRFGSVEGVIDRQKVLLGELIHPLHQDGLLRAALQMWDPGTRPHTPRVLLAGYRGGLLPQIAAWERDSRVRATPDEPDLAAGRTSAAPRELATYPRTAPARLCRVGRLRVAPECACHDARIPEAPRRPRSASSCAAGISVGWCSSLFHLSRNCKRRFILRRATRARLAVVYCDSSATIAQGYPYEAILDFG